MLDMVSSDGIEAVTYSELHATVVDAIRYVTSGQPIEVAADEVLERLRDAGLQVPSTERRPAE